MKCDNTQNYPAIILACLMAILYLVLGITGFFFTEPTCLSTGSISLNNFTFAASICCVIGGTAFIFCLVGIFLDWAGPILIVAWTVQALLCVLNIIGIVALIQGANCYNTAYSVWSMGMAFVVSYFIGLLIYIVGFIIACNK